MVASRNVSIEYTIIYVLGSGKGTQCSNIAAHLGFCHLSAGELLEREAESGSENGTMIRAFKKEGKLLPSGIIIELLRRAMEESNTKKFLIDGFPRNDENLSAAENIMKIEPEFVLFFECSTEVMISRILNRNQGRADDNRETAEKRLKVYFDSTLPVVNYYSSMGKIHKIDGEQTVEDVFEAVKSVFSKFKWRKSGEKTCTPIQSEKEILAGAKTSTDDWWGTSTSKVT